MTQLTEDLVVSRKDHYPRLFTNPRELTWPRPRKSQLLCFDGPWVNARPKARRWGIFHAPGRLIHRSRQRIVRSSTAGPAPTPSSAPTAALP
jgi:hypothetical protein